MNLPHDLNLDTMVPSRGSPTGRPDGNDRRQSLGEGRALKLMQPGLLVHLRCWRPV